MSVVRIRGDEVCPKQDVLAKQSFYTIVRCVLILGEKVVFLSVSINKIRSLRFFKDKLETGKDIENKKQKVDKLVSMCRKYPTIYHKFFNQKNFSIAWPQIY